MIQDIAQASEGSYGSGMSTLRGQKGRKPEEA